MQISSKLQATLVMFIVIVTLAYIVYLSYYDYKNHGIKRRRYLLMFYPFVFYANYSITGNILITFIAFFFLFLVFYITEVINPREGIGTADILAAPLFTVWFNAYSFMYTLLFLALYFICWIPFVNKNIMNRNKDTISVALLPIMFVTFVICLVIFPSNLAVFFSTFWQLL